MRLEFDEGTLLLENAPETVPYAEWDDRVDASRAQAYRYRALLEWAGQWVRATAKQHSRMASATTLQTLREPIPISL